MQGGLRYMNLGKALQEYRKSEGFTQSQMAEQLYISRQAYSSYENGARTPSVYHLYELSKLWKVTIDEIMRRAEELE